MQENSSVPYYRSCRGIITDINNRLTDYLYSNSDFLVPATMASMKYEPLQQGYTESKEDSLSHSDFDEPERNHTFKSTIFSLLALLSSSLFFDGISIQDS